MEARSAILHRPPPPAVLCTGTSSKCCSNHAAVLVPPRLPSPLWPTQLKPPVLLMWGTSDEIISPSLANKWADALGPSRCKLVWVERAGHSPHLERPDFVAQQVCDFLADLAPAPVTVTEEVEVPVPVPAVAEKVPVPVATVAAAAAPVLADVPGEDGPEVPVEQEVAVEQPAVVVVAANVPGEDGAEEVAVEKEVVAVGQGAVAAAAKEEEEVVVVGAAASER